MWLSGLKMAQWEKTAQGPPMTTPPQVHSNIQTLASVKPQPGPLSCLPQSTLGCFGETAHMSVLLSKIPAALSHSDTRKHSTCGGEIYDQLQSTSYSVPRAFPFLSPILPPPTPTPPSPSPHPCLGTLYTRVGRLTWKEPEAWMREKGEE